MKLHELHQRRLDATVSLIDESLARMERLLSTGGRNGIVRTVEDTLPAVERAALLEKLHALQTALRRFAERFSLARHPVDIRQILNAELSSAWVMLENCRPKRMKGYGQAFEEGARKTLEESVEQLLEAIRAMRAKLQ